MARTNLTLDSRLPLANSSAKIPILGFGVYQIDPKDTKEACLAALKSGYRHIDTAQLYGNEAEVGAAVTECGLPREELFITTKIRYPRLGKGKTYQRLLQSVEKIDPREGGYVDLFLIHSPYGCRPKERREMWLALEQLFADGRVKAIGVSNWAVEHFEELKEYATVWPPAVNQILLHPWHQQREVVTYCEEHGIVLEAFSPLDRGAAVKDTEVCKIAEHCGKTPAQVLICYALQHGWVPLVKTEKEERIRENTAVFDFALSSADLATLDKLGGASKTS